MDETFNNLIIPQDIAFLNKPQTLTGTCLTFKKKNLLKILINDIFEQAFISAPTSVLTVTYLVLREISR